MFQARFCVTLVLLLQTSLKSDTAALEDFLNKERYQAQIEKLSSPEFEGRGSGTPGQHAAADYIAEQFKKYGLEPVGDKKTYFQHFSLSLPKGPKVGAATQLSFTTKTDKLEINRDEIQPFGFSKNGTAKGNLVFVGYSIKSKELKYDDYASIDVKGKIVLCLRHSPGEMKPNSPFGPQQTQIANFLVKAKNAEAAGASGMILVNDVNHSGDELMALWTAGDQSDIPVLQMKRSVAEDLFKLVGKDLKTVQNGIDESLKPDSFELSGVTASLRTELLGNHQEKVTTENVVGLLRGSDSQLAQQCVVIGAHHDHVGIGTYGIDSSANRGKIHPGADDNASGSSGLLELAGAFSQANPKPRRSILFIAFSGEELGLLGSVYYVKNPIVPLKDTIAMINMDMIGRSKDGFCEISATSTAKEWNKLVEKCGQNLGLNIKNDPTVPSDSDHYSFTAKRIPALCFFTGFHADYHRPTDTPDKINSVDAIKILRLGLRISYELANQPGRFVFVEKDD